MTAGEGFGVNADAPGRLDESARSFAARAALTAPHRAVLRGGAPGGANAAPASGNPGSSTDAAAPAGPAVIRPRKHAPPPRRTTAPHGSAAR